MRLAELGEFGLLAELERRGLAVGIEHDAAEFEDGVVVTQDALVEDVHFRLDWTSWHDLGYKAAAVNLSDLAASGATPLGLAVTLGAPPATELERVIELYDGLNEPRVPVVGGDTTTAERLYLSVTGVGRSERVPGRAGARPGDVLVVTGPLGASAAGFLCLERGIDSPLVTAHRRPPLRLDQGRALAAHAHALLDISDGLAADAAHIAERSGCRCVIEVERVPVAAGVAVIAARLGRDVDELSCGFGEDYELLAAVENPGGFTVVGRCEAGDGVELLREGRPLRLSGWEHFTNS
jgi:thiamine-monophosphate kinase